MMQEFFNKLLWVPPVMPLTINRVLLSTTFRNLLFIVIALSFVIASLILRKKYRPTIVFKKAFLAAFFTAGMLYAFNADHIWGSWFFNHSQIFFGLGTEDKLLRLDGKIYAFSRAIKQVVEGEYELFSSLDRTALRIEYFLLPLRKRERAPYIVVIDDRHVQYDPASHTFTYGGIKDTGVDLVLEFSDDAYVLKRKR